MHTRPDVAARIARPCHASSPVRLGRRRSEFTVGEHRETHEIDHRIARVREPHGAGAAARAIASPHRLARRPSANAADSVTLVGRRGWGPGALIGGIIAGALIAAAISEGRADDRDMRRCDRDFRGFDPRSGNVHRSLRRRARLPVPALADRPHARTLHEASVAKPAPHRFSRRVRRIAAAR